MFFWSHVSKTSLAQLALAIALGLLREGANTILPVLVLLVLVLVLVPVVLLVILASTCTGTT
jgi:hypothetical protein